MLLPSRRRGTHMTPNSVGRGVRNVAVAAVVGSTVVLTAAFVGLAALIGGQLSGSLGRVPFYLLVAAIVFMLTLWKLDDRERDGLTVLVAVTGIGLLGGVIFGLAVEGANFAISNPSTVFHSWDVIVFFAAAAIICTGLGLWGVRHWREVVRIDPAGGESAEPE